MSPVERYAYEMWRMPDNHVKPKKRLKKVKKELLAQPKQEPVVWQLVANFITDGDILQYTYSKPRDELYEHYRVTPLYASPPTSEPLSDDEICNLYYNVNGAIHKFARAIEKAHGIGDINNETN